MLVQNSFSGAVVPRMSGPQDLVQLSGAHAADDGGGAISRMLPAFAGVQIGSVVGVVGGAAAGLWLGSAHGSVAGAIGTIVGGAGGALVGAVAGGLCGYGFGGSR